MPAEESAFSRGELSARPGRHVDAAGKLGLLRLEVDGAEAGLLYVPASYVPDVAAPLVVMLHGAGGTAQHSLDLVKSHADRLGFVVLAPKSRGATWDIIAGQRYGPDVAVLDALLRQVTAAYAIAPDRIAIGGFSDGASYALSLGLTNGDLFPFILAFSPGFMVPTRDAGEPHVFISHGVEDRVLPIVQCSRRIVGQLQAAGYSLDYREFQGGHIVPEELARAAFEHVVEGSFSTAKSA